MTTLAPSCRPFPCPPKEIPCCFTTISHVWVFTHKKLGFCAFELGGTPIRPNPMGCWGVIILDHVAPM
jgi:hypothetical protein